MNTEDPTDDHLPEPPHQLTKLPAMMDHTGSMTAQIVGGVRKEDCQHVTDQESSELWDSLALEVAEIKAKGWMVQILDD